MEQLDVAPEEQFNDNETQTYLKKYTVKFNRGNGIEKEEFTELNDALVLLDRLTDYGYGTDNMIAFYQADNLVKMYHKRQWVFPKTSIYQ